MAVGPPRPLSEADNRDAFDCGRESLNMWFRRHALANHLGGFSRVSVLADAASDRIIGYARPSAAQIERRFLPKAQQRNQPENVPATLLGRLAVDKLYQKQGHAASLLVFGLRTALRAAKIIGSAGVITHPLDDDVRRLYRKWGFEDLPFDLGRAKMVRMIDLQKAFEE